MFAALFLLIGGFAGASNSFITNFPFGYQINSSTGSKLTLPLRQFFSVDPVANTNLLWVSTDTGYGGFLMELLPTNAPKTVANFLSYVKDGAYEHTVVHRSTSLNNEGLAVIQTGGFTSDSSLSPIPTFAPITNEYSMSNAPGTVAMAKTTNPNSATSQWFINVSDNSSTLDTNNNSGYAVFARILGNGMINVIDPISQLQTYNLYSYNAAFTETPLQGVTNGQATLYRSNLVTFTRVATIPYFAFSSDSDAFPADLVTSPSGTNLVVTFRHYPTNDPIAGVHVTVTVTDTNGHNPTGLHNAFTGSTNDTAIIVVPATLGSQSIIFPQIPQQALSNNVIVSITTNYVQDGNNVSIGSITTNTRTSLTISPFPRSSVNVPVMLQILSGPICVTTNTSQKTGILEGTEFTLTGTGTVSLKATTYSSTNPVNLGYTLGDGTPLVNLYYAPATPVTSSFVVKAKAQSIAAFSSLVTQQTYGDSPFQIVIPASTSELPVSVKVLSGPASFRQVSNTGTITITGAGLVTLAANQSGNALYAPAPQVTTSFNVAKADQTITFPQASTNLAIGQTITLSATSSSKLPVSFSLIGGPATLTGSSLKITAPGTVSVAAIQNGNSNYLPATPVTNSYRTASNQTIGAFTPIPNRTYTNPAASLTITNLQKASSGLPVAFSVKSGPASLSTNSNSFTISLFGAGTVTLAANQAGNSNYFAAPEVKTSFVVSKASQTISSFSGLPSKITNGIDRFTVTIPLASSGLTNTTLRVSGAGALSSSNIITITNAGTLFITATNAGDSNYLAASLTTNIPVAKGNQTITFSLPPQLTNGTTKDLSAKASSKLSVTYSLSPSVTNVSLVVNSIIVRSYSTNSFKVVASQAGNSGWNAATSVTNSFTVVPNSSPAPSPIP